MKRWIANWFVVCSMLGLGDVADGQAKEAAPREVIQRGSHGGRISVSGDFRFEVVFSSRSLEIFALDRAGLPVQVGDVRGRAVFALEKDRRTFRYDLYAPGRDANPPNRLYLAADLSRLPAQGTSVTIVLYGLAERPVEFAMPFQRTLTRQQIAIQRQRICPVSGKLLGSMGQPPRLTIGDREVFVCCAGCARPLKKNPRLHLAKLPPPLVAEDGATASPQLRR